METADFDVADFDNQNQNKGVYGTFYLQAIKDEDATAREGRPMFMEREYIEIITSGSSSNVIRRPVTNMDKNRFPKSYAMFKQGNTEQLIGTPLKEVTWISVSQLAMFSAMNVRTVEHLAELNDAKCIGNPGVYELKRTAQQFVERAKNQAPLTSIMKENADLKKRIESLESLLSRFSEDDAIEAVKKKRGRPAKEA